MTARPMAIRYTLALRSKALRSGKLHRQQEPNDREHCQDDHFGDELLVYRDCSSTQSSSKANFCSTSGYIVTKHPK